MQAHAITPMRLGARISCAMLKCCSNVGDGGAARALAISPRAEYGALRASCKRCPLLDVDFWQDSSTDMSSCIGIGTWRNRCGYVIVVSTISQHDGLLDEQCDSNVVGC
jgi:hypothetical protein